MNSFAKKLTILGIGIALGYAWAYNSYMPHIKAQKAALATYQEYFLKNTEPINISATPQKFSRKKMTNGTNN